MYCVSTLSTVCGLLASVVVRQAVKAGCSVAPGSVAGRPDTKYLAAIGKRLGEGPVSLGFEDLRCAGGLLVLGLGCDIGLCALLGPAISASTEREKPRHNN